MPTSGLKLTLVAITCGLVISLGTDSRSAPADPATPAGLLESKGIRKTKKSYVLLAEQDVFRKCQETMDAYATASQAIGQLGEADATNQAITGLSQRMAMDRASVANMRILMRDGKTIELRDELRAAERDRNIARGNRGVLAPTKPNPKQLKKMADQAQEAGRVAEASKVELSQKVRAVIDRYQSLRSDPGVREALGGARFGPSEEFGRLAAHLGIAIPKPQSSGPIAPISPGAMPKRLTDAMEELIKAEDQLQGFKFDKTKKQTESRERRRDQTVKAIRDAIDKLKKGEVDVKIVEEASKLNGEYDDGRMVPKNRDGIKDVGDRLKKAAELMRGKSGT